MAISDSDKLRTIGSINRMPPGELHKFLTNLRYRCANKGATFVEPFKQARKL